jgi:hypothetical protein
VAGKVEGLIGLVGQFVIRADGFNEAVTNEKTTAGNLPTAAVKGYQEVSVFDQ